MAITFQAEKGVAKKGFNDSAAAGEGRVVLKGGMVAPCLQRHGPDGPPPQQHPRDHSGSTQVQVQVQVQVPGPSAAPRVPATRLPEARWRCRP